MQRTVIMYNHTIVSDRTNASVTWWIGVMAQCFLNPEEVANGSILLVK